MNKEPFAICPGCQHIWETRDDFIDDSSTLIHGYQANLESLPEGLFVFTHTIPDCRATVSIKAKEFLDLYTGPNYSNADREHVDGCPLYCEHEDNLGRCDKVCECAYVREVIAMLAERRVDKSPFMFKRQ